MVYGHNKKKLQWSKSVQQGLKTTKPLNAFDMIKPQSNLKKIDNKVSYVEMLDGDMTYIAWVRSWKLVLNSRPGIGPAVLAGRHRAFDDEEPIRSTHVLDKRYNVLSRKWEYRLIEWTRHHDQLIIEDTKEWKKNIKEYKAEMYPLFREMLASISKSVLTRLKQRHEEQYKKCVERADPVILWVLVRTYSGEDACDRATFVRTLWSSYHFVRDREALGEFLESWEELVEEIRLGEEALSDRAIVKQFFIAISNDSLCLAAIQPFLALKATNPNYPTFKMAKETVLTQEDNTKSFALHAQLQNPEAAIQRGFEDNKPKKDKKEKILQSDMVPTSKGSAKRVRALVTKGLKTLERLYGADGKSGGKFKKTPSSDFPCFNCGKTTHWSNKCPDESALCTTCNENGHLARFCKTIQKINNRKKSLAGKVNVAKVLNTENFEN